MRRLFLLMALVPLIGLGQERLFTVRSKDSINGRPVLQSSLGANIKLNGYYDFFGGLQGNETFNVGMIDVFGTDDSPSFNMDLYQTQLKFEGTYFEKNGERVYAIVEADFWGGNGRFRLRKAYVESRHWQIGQNWNNFGDEMIWPNIMEWEGPPSGIWARTPHVKYSNTFRNEVWIYELSLEAPINNYISFEEFGLNVDEANQVTPDLTLAFKRVFSWGHLRLSSIARNIRYRLDGEIDNFFGYGFSLTGLHVSPKRNMLQFQLVAGEGITAYMTSIAGQGYDGYQSIDNGFTPTPAAGGWASYEYYLTSKLHANAVLGFTRYNFKNIKEFTLIGDEDIEERVIQGDFVNSHFYGILNLMYDPFPRMTIGVEIDYGWKNIDFDGFVDNVFETGEKRRDAMRMSFGFMFYI